MIEVLDKIITELIPFEGVIYLFFIFMFFSIITCNNILTLSISKYTLNTSVENNLYNLLIQNNIKVKVYGSENYDNKK